MSRKLNVAIVGLGFGAEFIPIYQRHPNANMYAICQRNVQKLHEIGDAYGIDKRYSNYDELLADPDVDAVHINSPIPNHAEHSLKALRAGKHVACTVPMATTVDECLEIVRVTNETGKKYMMMETVVYSREFLFVKELYEKGELGKVQFLKASHQQDMDGWPDYWPGLPPMHYATHCVGPVAGLLKLEAEYVSCFGSGTIREELAKIHNSPFAVESAHIKFKNSDLSAYVYRSLFDVARQYRESFEVYGDKKSFEWPLIEDEKPVIHTAKKPEPEIPEEVVVPDYAHYLPREIAGFTTKGVYDADDQQHLSFTQGGGHGGSHPHMVHEFLSAIIEDRDPFPNASQSANWTSVGILAHESALKGGQLVPIPDFSAV
ncbi:Gfo/Idh/MocA family oxidoreductase [Spirosoma sp. KCTC 42546]|uniref:Gfo/Idh/MocA family protein n=1 Tax=Spirosoma sp. KCTC 42546 TaxID=2520506 RepID=UPI00115B029D|nr:Gfo/Idh/MocA family oxidoreductase [Spirosoma sp. KCTC 42546]QDK79879.1 Gfo/Idh/MocA family oxidoreductase [Spirosoma sp. KCTC 42546]